MLLVMRTIEGAIGKEKPCGKVSLAEVRSLAPRFRLPSLCPSSSCPSLPPPQKQPFFPTLLARLAQHSCLRRAVATGVGLCSSQSCKDPQAEEAAKDPVSREGQPKGPDGIHLV